MDYDTALKKLINILKFKHTDGLKQIEDLWDTINLNATVKIIKDGQAIINNNEQNSNIPSKTTNIKRTVSDLETLNNNKKQKLSAPTVTTTTTIKKIFKSSNDIVNANGDCSNDGLNKKNDLNDLESKQQQQQQQAVKSLNNDVSIKFDNSNDDDSVLMMKIDDCGDGEKSNGVGSCGNGFIENHQITSKIDDYAIDMGLTCDICLTLAQEQNNKLAECQECKRLYHQQCHKPLITNEDIQDPRKLWYCSKCIKNVKKFANGNGKTNGKSVTNEKQSINNTTLVKNESNNSLNSVNSNNANDESLQTKSLYKRQNSNELNQQPQQQQQLQQQQSVVVNGNKDHENNNNHILGEQASTLHVNNNSNEQKLFFKRDPKTLITNEKPNVDTNVNSTNKPVKGLAVLANKFNFNSNINTSPKSEDKNSNIKNSNITSKQQQQQQVQQSQLLTNNSNNNSVNRLKQTTANSIPSFSSIPNSNIVKPIIKHPITNPNTTNPTSNNTNLGLTSPIAEKKMISFK